MVFFILLGSIYSLITFNDTYKDAHLIKRWRISTAILALIASLFGAYLKLEPSLNMHRATNTFISMVAVLVVSFIYALYLLTPIKKLLIKRGGKIYRNVTLALTSLLTIVYAHYYLAQLWEKTAEFMPYDTNQINTDVLARIAGWLLGIVIMLLLSLALYSTSKLCGTKTTSKYLIFALIAGSFTQIIEVLQRLYALRLIPRNRNLFKFISFCLNHSNWFTYLVLLILCLIPLHLFLQNRKIKGVFKNNAEKRKAKAQIISIRRWCVFVLMMVIVAVVSTTVIKELHNRETPLSDPEPYKIQNDQAIIPLDLLADTHLHRFEYQAKDGNKVRFIAIEKSENNYAVCLDACEICGASGYFERGDVIVCKLCDVVMNRGTIGFAGGCNPIPIDFVIENGEIHVALKTLDQESQRFR